MRPEIAADHTMFENDRNDLLEIATGDAVLCRLEKTFEHRRVNLGPAHFRCWASRSERHDFFPRIGMHPRPRLVEKKIGDEKRRAVRTTERELFERTVSDEDAARRSLDEGEVLHHAAILCVRSRAVAYQGP